MIALKYEKTFEGSLHSTKFRERKKRFSVSALFLSRISFQNKSLRFDPVAQEFLKYGDPYNM